MTAARHPGLKRTLIFGLSLVLIKAVGTAYAADKIYKWVDQNGEIQYTQMPPPGGVQLLEEKQTSRPADAADAERSRLQQQVDAMQERMKARQEAAAKAEQETKNREISRQNCAAARKNLAELQQGGATRYQTPGGEVLHLSDEDRERRITEANKQIAEFCKH